MHRIYEATMAAWGAPDTIVLDNARIRALRKKKTINALMGRKWSIWTTYQYGKSTQEVDTASWGRLSASWGGRAARLRPHEACFHFALWLQKKEPKSSWATLMFMNVHDTCMSTLHAPIYRNFYMCVPTKILFKDFDVERPLKVCALTGLFHAPLPKL